MPTIDTYSEATAISYDDVLYLLDNPAGAKASKRLPFATLGGLLGQSRLKANTAVGATTCSIGGLPKGTVVNSGWLLIDPYTSECEIRKWTGGTTTAPTFAALAYTHAADDPVLFINALVVYPEWFGAKGDGSTDDVTACQCAITQLGTGGGQLLFSPGNTYYLNNAGAATLTFPAACTALLVFSGYGATIKLSTNTPRFLSPNKLNDHDTFKNIIIAGFTIDGNGIQHKSSIIGYFVNGSALLRVNYQNIIIRDLRFTNIPIHQAASPTYLRAPIALDVSQADAGEGTQNYIRDIFIDNIRVEGAAMAVMITGASGGGGWKPGYNIYIDNVNVTRVWHDSLLSNAGQVSWQSSTVYIGGLAFGGRAYVADCESFNLSDAEFETNNMSQTVYERCYSKNGSNYSFYSTNFNYPGTGNVVTYDPAAQEITYRDCHVIHNVSVNGVGWQIWERPALSGPPTLVPLGCIRFEDCSLYRSVGVHTTPTNPVAINIGETTGVYGHIREVVIKNFTGVWEKWSYPAAAASTTPCLIVIAPVGPTVVKINGGHYYIEGDNDSGNDLGMYVFRFGGKSDGAYAPRFYFEGALTGKIDIETGKDYAIALLSVGVSAADVIESALISGLIPIAVGDVVHPRAVIVQGSTTLTINKQVQVYGCDFSALGAGADRWAVAVVDATNAYKTYVHDNIQAVWPLAPVAITVGASPYAWRNAGWYMAHVTVDGGTVSAIAWSYDGTNWYTHGVIAGTFAVPSGYYLRVTYTAAPNMRWAIVS